MKKNKKIMGVLGLFLASFFWGAEYVVEKDVLSMVGPNYSNAIRFIIASIICTILFIKRISVNDKSDYLKGILTGSFMGLGWALQTMGLKTINAGENALISSSYVIIIPFVEWLVLKKKPKNYIFFYTAMVLLGIHFITYDVNINEFQFSIGEVLTLAGAFCYAGGILSIGYYSSRVDPKLLILMQFYTTAFIAIIFALILEKPPTEFNLKLGIQFIYLIVFSTIFSQTLMNYCIKYVKATIASMIFSSEFVFAIILGIIFLNEKTEKLFWLGAILIISSITLSQYQDMKSDKI